MDGWCCFLARLATHHQHQFVQGVRYLESDFGSLDSLFQMKVNIVDINLHDTSCTGES